MNQNKINCFTDEICEANFWIHQKEKKNMQSIAVEAGFQQQQKTAAITLWPESLHFVQKNYLDFINKLILIK